MNTIEVNGKVFEIETDEDLVSLIDQQGIEIEYRFDEDQDGRIILDPYYLNGRESQQFFDENWEELQDKVAKHLSSIAN